MSAPAAQDDGTPLWGRWEHGTVTDTAGALVTHPLTAAARSRVPGVPLGVYVHVPWCRRRCGYCAFNTYVRDPAAPDDGTHRRFVDAVRAELALADAALGPDRPALTSVYLGGGTPSLLPPWALADVLDAVRDRFDVRPDTEITVEANPDDVHDRWLDAALSAGATRLSIGMQSAVASVLSLLDRAHDPHAAPAAATSARRAGFAHVGLDLIHGTPGETAADWDRTLDVALAAPVDHLSAYALGIEPGTRLAARVRAGSLPRPSGDDAADRYEVLDRRAAAAGLDWYELSNWSRGPDARCRHNLLAWRGHHWWGVGPGAHSSVGGVRWWNADHPDEWSIRLQQGAGPVAGHEVLTPAQAALERVMLGIRLADGLPLEDVARGAGNTVHRAGGDAVGGDAVGGDAADEVVADGLAERLGDRLVLTLRGRLLADLVVRRLTG
jgi:oxygen-independent coproporphyrinogen-3 oxidase